MEKNRDRKEYRTCQICKDATNLSKSQKEWLHVRSIGRIRQVRIPSEKDSQGNDVTPTIESVLRTGSKRMHWSIENRFHHVLDDTFREDRSPAKKSRNNLALIRKYACNILRLAMNETGLTNIMTEMMDCFCDDASLRERYVFQGIASLY